MTVKSAIGAIIAHGAVWRECLRRTIVVHSIAQLRRVASHLRRISRSTFSIQFNISRARAAASIAVFRYVTYSSSSSAKNSISCKLIHWTVTIATAAVVIKITDACTRSAFLTGTGESAISGAAGRSKSIIGSAKIAVFPSMQGCISAVTAESLKDNGISGREVLHGV